MVGTSRRPMGLPRSALGSSFSRATSPARRQIKIVDHLGRQLHAFHAADPLLALRYSAAPVKCESLMSEVLHHTSADALGRHQLADLLARVKHTCLHRVMRDADDFGDLINRFFRGNRPSQ
jgi:hypothetical protein